MADSRGDPIRACRMGEDGVRRWYPMTKEWAEAIMSSYRNGEMELNHSCVGPCWCGPIIDQCRYKHPTYVHVAERFLAEER